MVSSLAAHGGSSREVAEQGLEAIVGLGFDNDAAINRELGEAGAAAGDFGFAIAFTCCLLLWPDVDCAASIVLLS